MPPLAPGLLTLPGCLLGALALLAVGGCVGETNRPPPSGASFGRSTRTAEEARVFRGPLVIRRHSDYGFADLEIPHGGTRPLSLLIMPEELTKLETLDQTQTFEIRYWYHEIKYVVGPAFGRGELFSLGDGRRVMIDRTVCRRHDEPMTRRPVPIFYGLFAGEFMDDAQRDFPHAAFVLGGCVVMDDSARETLAYACVTCEAAHQAWTAEMRASLGSP